MGNLMDRIPKNKRKDCTEETYVVMCPNSKCKRQVKVKSVVCHGWKEKEEVSCPSCGTLVETITATFFEVE